MKIRNTLKKHTTMKKLMIILTALFTMTVSANAMSYEQARQQALFLTDKMAYELNLTEDQYEAAQGFLRSILLLPPDLLERRLLALRHLRTLSATRLLLFRTAALLDCVPRRTQLALQRRPLVVSRTQIRRAKPTGRTSFRYAGRTP